MNWLESRVVWVIAAIGVLVMVCAFGFLKGDAHGIASTMTLCSKKIATLDSHGTDPCSLAVGALQARYAQAQAKAAADALAKQAALENKYAAIDARHAQELTDAQQDAAGVIAGLKSGNLRLRHDWLACRAAAGVSQAAAGAGQPDATTNFRAASQDALFRAVGADIELHAQADAQIRALQAIVKADRQ